ncbi:MAG: flippase [Gammaproteobacteria bacterium]
MIEGIRKNLLNALSNRHFSLIVKGSAWVLVAKIAAAFVGLLNDLLISRYYGAGVLGMLALLNSFIMLIGLFSAVGTSFSIQRLIPDHLANYSRLSAYRVFKQIVIITTGCSMVTGAVFFFSSEWIATSVFKKPGLAPWFALSSLSVLLIAYYKVALPMFRAIKKIKLFALFHFIQRAVVLFLLLLAIGTGRDADAPLMIRIVSMIAVGIAGFVLLHRYFSRSGEEGSPCKRESYRELFSISSHMFLASSMGLLMSYTDTVMLGMMRSEAEVGVYSVAMKLYAVSLLILSTVKPISSSTFSELYSTGQTKLLARTAAQTSRLMFLASAPLIAVMIVFGPLVLQLFGDEFRSGYQTLLLLLAGLTIQTMSGSAGTLLTMTGHHKVLKYILLIATVLNIALNYLLIPEYGIDGAAFASLIGIAVINVAAVAAVKSRLGLVCYYHPFRKAADNGV